MSAPFQKAATLRDVRRQAQLDPLQAGDPRYVPLDDVRGQNVIKRLSRLLEDDETCVHIAYAGHRGGGKTTEIFRLIKKLEEEQAFCAYFDAHPELIMGDLDYTDVLLYISQKVLEKAQEKAPLNPDVLKAVENYFLEVTEITRDEIKSESSLEVSAKAEIGFPFLAKVLAAINARISGSTVTATELRNRFKKRPDQLIAKVNLLLEHAGKTLRRKGFTKLVLILDSLDRLDPEVLERAVLKQIRVFRQLKINLILTVPLAAIYMPQGESLESMGMKTLTLPMIAVRDKDQTWDQCNDRHVLKLVELIAARVQVETIFAAPNIVREMALLSGGSFRELFELLGESALAADTLPIAQAQFDEAAQQVWGAFKAALTFEDRELLAEIHREKECDRRAKVFRLLFHRFALEYNGVHWADVHPLIMRFDERFQKLLAPAP